MAKNGKGFLVAMGVGLGVYLLSREAKAMKKYKAPMQLTKNFNLLEFLDEHPTLKDYELNQEQFDNVYALAHLLQKGRNYLGVPIRVQSGCRPPDWRNPDGKDLLSILREKGYKPSTNSDHMPCGAADLGFASPEMYGKAAEYFAAQPETRQVILEYKTVKRDGVDNFPVPMAVHVAVVMPGRPKITGDNYAFVSVDGKFSNKLVYNQTLPGV